MITSVSSVLEARLEAEHVGPFRRAVVLAVGAHLAVVLAALLVPYLLRQPQQPIDFVSVQIVPAARLGIVEPKPAPKAPEPAKPQVRPEPRPAPKPVSDAPVLKPARSKPEPAKRVEPAPPETQGVAGGALAGMALGAPTATFDAPDFTYGYYVDQMLSKISSNWSRPLVGGGVEAWLHFEIARDGEVGSVRITRSSGINSFDLAALRAVQASSPLPPLPRAFRESSLGVNLIVR